MVVVNMIVIRKGRTMTEEKENVRQFSLPLSFVSCFTILQLLILTRFQKRVLYLYEASTLVK